MMSLSNSNLKNLDTTEKTLTNLCGESISVIDSYVEHMKSTLSEIENNKTETSLKKLVSTAILIKNICISSGFEILANISTNLCQFLSKTSSIDKKTKSVINLHIDAMKAFIAKKDKKNCSECIEVVNGLKKICLI